MAGLSTREKILKSSIQLFEERGYHGVGIEEIIRVSETSKGGFYYNFKSKEELLFTIHDQYINEALQRGYECYKNHNTPIQRLAAIIKDLLLGIAKHKASVTVFFQDYKCISGTYLEIIEEKRDSYENLMVKIIEEGIAANEIRSELPPKLMSKAIFGVVDWTYIWFKKRGEYSMEEIADVFVDFILKSVIKDKLYVGGSYSHLFLNGK